MALVSLLSPTPASKTRGKRTPALRPYNHAGSICMYGKAEAYIHLTCCTDGPCTLEAKKETLTYISTRIHTPYTAAYNLI